MMLGMKNSDTGVNMFAPKIRARIIEDAQWLTINDAVTHCAERGLSRTPKTIRRWASRSHSAPENAEISVRREDTENGFRYTIEATSLTRKIDEELKYEAQKQTVHEHTGVDVDESVHTHNNAESSQLSGENMSGHEQTEPNLSGDRGQVEEELRHQLDHARGEIEFLREELTHRRHTDEALGKVIEAFRLNAETSKAQLQETQQKPGAPNWGGGYRHDIVHNQADETEV